MGQPDLTVVSERSSGASRKAAQECSPGRKPLGKVGNERAPAGRKNSSHTRPYRKSQRFCLSRDHVQRLILLHHFLSQAVSTDNLAIQISARANGSFLSIWIKSD